MEMEIEIEETKRREVHIWKLVRTDNRLIRHIYSIAMNVANLTKSIISILIAGKNILNHTLTQYIF